MMPYSFPKIKFADTNTLEQQLEHVRSEHMEVWKAYMAGELGHLVEELFDLQQSCDTALRVIARLHPEMDLGAARQAMLQKNVERRYYNAEEDHPEKASASGALDIGKRIRDLRLEKGYTQKELADMVGITPVAITRYEQNQREPNLEMLNKIATALGVPFVAMFAGDVDRR